VTATADVEAGVVVIGGGMSGLAAGIDAARAGARVTVLEKAECAGGSARMSGGLVWTEPTPELLAARNPHGDPELGGVLANRFEEALAWLRGCGLELTDRMTGLFGTGEGHRLQPDMPTVMDRLEAELREAGGELLCGAAARELLLAGGRVTGVVLADGRTVPAAAVILCTGGFQGNVELLTRYVTPYADLLHVRANRGSTGDGFAMGLAAGAACSRGLHAFYGHLLPAPPARITPDRYIALTQYHSIHGVLVNAAGARFVDESVADEVSAQALAREQHATGFMILDARAAEHVSDPPAPAFPRYDRLAKAEEAGALVLRAATLDALGELIDGAGGSGRRAVLELESYNRLVATDPGALTVPRRSRRRALDEPPFVAMAVRPAITFTEGGLLIDTGARVLDRDGHPIGGLYAAGADGGGVFYEHYAGGLALSVVFGRLAGSGAAAVARDAVPAR
jgi:succinate dehydrogenase/fumarate reductase flavoprotein subunit